MRRRMCMAFVGAVILTLAALPGSAQPSNMAGKVFRLGVLSPDRGFIERLRIDAIPELAREGFVEGSNLIVDSRAGTPQMLAALARELLAAKPDAIIANTSQAIDAVKSLSDKVPIIGWYIGGDPIAAGFAISLARPGRNVTGIVMLAPELDAKRLDALLEALPKARRVATLSDPTRAEPQYAALRQVGQAHGIELVHFSAEAPAEFPAVFAAIREADVQALAILSSPQLLDNASTLAALALAARLPTVCEWGVMAKQGCLVGYGPNRAELQRRAASYVVRIFRGATPSELPMELPTRFELVINLKTARALGVALPPALLSRADEVIE